MSGTLVRDAVVEDGGVLSLVIEAGKGNILSGPVMDALCDALEAHGSDRALRLVTLRGSGGHFSFGASVPEHQKDKAAAMLTTFHALCREMFGYPVPIASIVEGKCLGGALEVVLCSHVVFCTPNAVFACPEIKLGVFPPVLAALGPSRLSPPLAERMVITGAEIDAKRAHAAGFVADILEGDPGEAVLKWYRANLAPLSAHSVRQATAAVRVDSGAQNAFETALEAAEMRYLAKLLPSHDGNEGINAFLEKRAPSWGHA